MSSNIVSMILIWIGGFLIGAGVSGFLIIRYLSQTIHVIEKDDK